MLAERELYTAWLKQRPNDYNLRFEAANIDSFLGSLMLEQGKLKEAESYYSAQEDTMRRNRVEDPDNIKWKDLHSDSKRFLTTVQAMQGKREQARASALEAAKIVAELTELDPKNNVWSHYYGHANLWLAKLTGQNRQEAKAYADKAQSIISGVYTQEPSNEKVALSLARTRNFQAQLVLWNDNTNPVSEHTQAALDLVAPFWKIERHRHKVKARIARAYLCIIQKQTQQRRWCFKFPSLQLASLAHG